MAKYLKFSPDVRIPADAGAQQWAFLGRTGRGKSYGAGVLAESLLDAKTQVVVLDPVGNWWGLRIGKGGGPGFNIPVFGGLHGDIPLNPEAGAMIANLIVDRGISAVLDVSNMRKAQARRFATAFAEELFEAKKRNRSRLHLIIEEAQRFIPQKSGPGDKAMLGAFEDVAKIGRQFGIGWTVITQRPQSVNKDVLNQAEPLVVLQLTGKHERKAVREWIDEHGVEVDEMFLRISKLKKGEAFLWSPSWLEKLVAIKIGKKRTYDSSATPDDTTKQREPKPLSKGELKKLGQDIERVAQEAAENNPTALRQRVSKLERDLAAAKRDTPAPKVEIKRVEVPIVDAKLVKRLEAVAYKMTMFSGIRHTIEDLRQEIDRITDIAEKNFDIAVRDEAECVAKGFAPKHDDPDPPPRKPRPAVRPLRPRPDAAPGEPPPKKMRTGAINMLKALATMGRDLSRGQVAMLAGMSAKGGSFRTYQSDLRVNGFIDDIGTNLTITDAGLAYLNGDYGDTPRTVHDIANLFKTGKRRLRDGAVRMLDALLSKPRYRWSRAELAEASEMDLAGGSFRTYLSNLKSTGLITTNRQDVGIAPGMLELV